MKSIIATVQMRPLSTNTIGPSPVPSVPSSPPPGSHTPQKDPDPSSPSISLSSLTNLDELDLSSKKLPPSRPIGEKPSGPPVRGEAAVQPIRGKAAVQPVRGEAVVCPIVHRATCILSFPNYVPCLFRSQSTFHNTLSH